MMGSEGEPGTEAEQIQLQELQREKEMLQLSLDEARTQLSQLQEEKMQIRKCYDQAIQEVADSEAKREVTEKELRFAHDQISSMWKELENMRRKLDSPLAVKTTTEQPPSSTCIVNDSSVVLLCRLCQEKINAQQVNPAPTHPSEERYNNSCSRQNSKQQSPHSPKQQNPQSSPKQSPHNSPKQQRSRKSNWLFGKRQQKIQDAESHSKVCSSNSSSNPSSPGILTKQQKSSSNSLKTGTRVTNSPSRGAPSSSKGGGKGAPGRRGQGEDYLQVNVTRSSSSSADMAPFKVVTKTNLPMFPSFSLEVHRSQGDFQWLHSALQEVCPERVVPPLRPPISLDATISEFQRFLSRVAAHNVLSNQHLFIVFLSGTAEELRALRAKHRPRRHSDRIRYKPAMGRDTNSGPLVDTKDYLTMLEQNLVGLSSHLEQSSRKGHGSPMERAAHWFQAISDSEPDHTYLKRASTDLARTCEAMESQVGDSDEMLFIQNLQSLTDYVRVAQDLLTRVEEAVDQYLYWDEEVTIIEAVNSSPVVEQPPGSQESGDNDSGVSDVTGSTSTDSTSGDHTHSHSHMTIGTGSHNTLENRTTSERWAHASKQCADAKDYLEMMCRDLAEELSLFDLQKEKELKQILLDYASAQLERHEKFQGKWFAMRFLLDSAISMENRAIQFNPTPTTAPTADVSPAPQSIPTNQLTT